jgi:hypothetical protein
MGQTHTLEMTYPPQDDAPAGQHLIQWRDSVEVVDPTHPLYGLTLPLIGITQKRASVVMCAVWLQPGIERLIPIAVTTEARAQVVRTRCRLSIASSGALLAVVASLPKGVWDHGSVRGEAEATRARRRHPRSGSRIRGPRGGRGQRTERAGAREPGVVEPLTSQSTPRQKPVRSDLPGDQG